MSWHVLKLDLSSARWMPKLVSIDTQSYPGLTSQSLRATIGPLQDNWPLFHYVIGISGILPYNRNVTLQTLELFSAYARLYNAAASPALRLRLAGLVGNKYLPRKKLKYSKLEFKFLSSNFCYESHEIDVNLSIILKEIPQSSSRQTTIVCWDQEPFSSNKSWGKLWFTPWKNKSSINFPSLGVLFVFISKHCIFVISWWCSYLLPVEAR